MAASKKQKQKKQSSQRQKKQSKLQDVPDKDNQNDVFHNDNDNKVSYYKGFLLCVVAIMTLGLLVLQNDSKSVDPVEVACNYAMAESSLPDSGWGMFRLTPAKRGEPVTFGDIVIPVPDLSNMQHEAIGQLLHNYMWTAHATGGMHEGNMVYSALPGIGSLSNGHPKRWNVAPQSGGALVDEAGLSRKLSPGAGAVSHYHSFTFYAYHDIEAGGEILSNYGRGWSSKLHDDDNVQELGRPVDWLRQNGICLDHIRPGPSLIPHAGRGAFATRFLPRGSVVAPAPLIPITGRIAVYTGRTPQLLTNYLFGHQNSSVLFFPYAPTINLINHNRDECNVRLQWSTKSLHYGRHLLDKPVEDLYKIGSNSPTAGLLMEFVATRDIEAGEEILMDYGKEWQQAWDQHVQAWQQQQEENHYDQHQYAHELNKNEVEIRTQQEQREKPYPSNLHTTCAYKHHQHGGSVRWEAHPGVKELSNLYPCKILRRYQGNYYTVEILPQEDIMTAELPLRAPKGQIVTNVPRMAICFSDKLYASDQHLAHAFRHEIGIPNDLFPKSWMDAKPRQ